MAIGGNIKNKKVSAKHLTLNQSCDIIIIERNKRETERNNNYDDDKNFQLQRTDD